MSQLQQRNMEKILFDNTTTYRTDYYTTPIKAPVTTVYKEKPRCMRIKPPPLKDVHTLCNWKTSGIPFNLLHKPRPHIDTDPTKVQKPCFEPPDHGKDQAIKTRPRLVMTPAVSMDDITDRKARDILIEDMYTSDMTRGLKEAIRPYFRVAAPLPDHPANSNPIKLPKLVPPYVCPEWRIETVTWDNKQLRSYCDTTKDFWLSRKLRPCTFCDQSNKAHARNKMMCQLKPGKSVQRK